MQPAERKEIQQPHLVTGYRATDVLIGLLFGYVCSLVYGYIAASIFSYFGLHYNTYSLPFLVIYFFLVVVGLEWIGNRYPDLGRSFFTGAIIIPSVVWIFRFRI